MKSKWLDRRIAAPGPFLTLCLSEEEYLAAATHCKIKYPQPWIKTEFAHATVHQWTTSCGFISCVVCLNDYEGRDPVEVAGLLVHESVHIWQDYCNAIGETRPGTEQEAYAIQAIAQELMAEFARRMA